MKSLTQSMSNNNLRQVRQTLKKARGSIKSNSKRKKLNNSPHMKTEQLISQHFLKSKTAENSALDRYAKFATKWNNKKLDYQKVDYNNQLDMILNSKPYS